MKQIKSNNILYVIDENAYQITNDLDVEVIFVPEDKYSEYSELNPTLSLTKYNYKTFRCTYENEYFKPIEDRYLTIEAITDTTVNFTKVNNQNKVIYYSEDWGDTWAPLESTVTVTAGNGIFIKSDLVPIVDKTNRKYGIGEFVTTGTFNVSGNPLSLIKSDNFRGIKDISNYPYIFASLFVENNGLISAKELSLCSLTVSDSAYLSMFDSCANLIEVPTLPATKLDKYCYEYMFWGCTKIENVQTCLPATTLAYGCYLEMFSGCSSLKTAPKLPATTLANYCYNKMFLNCTSLTTAPVLSATKLTESCYANMFDGCTSLTTVPALPATTLANYCYSATFYGCTSLVNVPELPATTLANGCYWSIFENCNKVNNITIKATDISVTDCLKNWVKGVSGTGTIHIKNGVNYPTGVNGIPTGWTVETI